MSRKVQHSYEDPLALIWLEALHSLGWRLQRSSEAYASWDGAGTLTLSTASEFDADDNLAQMIFHEICHALVAGPAGVKQTDWGLDNTSERDVVQEHACNRLQAALSAPYGLRAFLAVTTEFRTYYDALPENPLRDGDDPAIAFAQAAARRAELAPYASVLSKALEATAQLAALLRPHAPEGSLWRLARARHRLGFPLLENADPKTQSCGSCAWAYRDASLLACLQASANPAARVAVREEEAACERWQARFGAEECGRCGACCHKGFDLVQVEPSDEFLQRYPDLVTSSSLGLVLLRPGGRCPMLAGDGDAGAPYRCVDYETRPSSCRDFEVRGDACLLARRRVGLSR
jgi:hypothetical protein